MKECSRCKTEKSLDSFTKHSSRPDGLSRMCRSCQKDTRKPNHSKASLYANLSSEARERERIRKKQWRKDHPEVVSAINRRTYVKRKGVLVEASAKETREFMESNRFCVRCKATECLTLDHIIPISWGILSRHSIDNFQVLCNQCNATKNNYVSYDLRGVEGEGFDLFDLL